MKELSQLGPFTLLGKIGEGGMGAFYKACDSRLNRVVAIKLLPPGDRRTSDRQAGAGHRGPKPRAGSGDRRAVYLLLPGLATHGHAL